MPIIARSPRFSTSVRGFLLIGLILAGVPACSKESGTNPQQPATDSGGAGARGGGRSGRGGAGGTVPVVPAHVVSKPVPVTIPAVGTAEPLAPVQIRAQVTGQLSAIHFTEGQDVRKGTPLF